MSLWFTSLLRVTVTKAWVQPRRSQWAGARAVAEGRLVDHSYFSPVPTVPEAPRDYVFSLCVK